MDGLVFRLADGARVKISSPALARMLDHRQAQARRSESGGVLLGRYISGCRDIIVDEVTTPMAGDRWTRFSFYRSHAPHQRVIDERWLASRGTCQYLGEWHTHPELYPSPSRIDLDDWRRRLRTDEFDSDSLMFVIVGIREVRAWQGLRGSGEICALEPAGARSAATGPTSDRAARR